jgi:raffinose/stachyose/melibiose transport system permease protein
MATLAQPLSDRKPLKPTALVFYGVKYAALIALALITLMPLFWIWMNSLRSTREFNQDQMALPTALVWTNYINAWTTGKFDTYLINSLITTLPTVAGVMLLSAVAGYGLWRFKFRGNRIIFFLFLIGLMLPFQAIMVPLYFRLRDFGLLSTYWGVILPGIAFGLPFGIFLMRAFFSGLSHELVEAALVDGCGEARAFWSIMLPLTKPALTSLAVFQFMWSWNNFIMPFLYLQREELRTLPLGLMLFQGRYTTDFGTLFAGITIATLPVVVTYILFQRKVTEGLTAGALKG